MNEQQAKEFVIKTILEGDKNKIARVIQRFQKVYGKKRSGGDKESVRPESTLDRNLSPQDPEFWEKE